MLLLLPLAGSLPMTGCFPLCTQATRCKQPWLHACRLRSRCVACRWPGCPAACWSWRSQVGWEARHGCAREPRGIVGDLDPMLLIRPSPRRAVERVGSAGASSPARLLVGTLHDDALLLSRPLALELFPSPLVLRARTQSPVKRGGGPVEVRAARSRPSRLWRGLDVEEAPPRLRCRWWRRLCMSAWWGWMSP